MYPLLFFLAAGQDPTPELPPASDTRRFPTYPVCRAQVERAGDHIAWLAVMAPAWPEWHDRWEAWTQQGERDRFLWGVLAEAVDWDVEQGERRQRLARYEWHVTPARYAAGFTPPILPAGLHPEPRPPVPVPTVPRRDVRGNGR